MLLLAALLPLLSTIPGSIPEAADGGAVVLEDVTIVSSKNIGTIDEVVSPVSTFGMTGLEEMGVRAPKGLSALVPNLWMPDYGSAMTSSIYMRGFGSRMDNPVMSLYVDDVPVLDKNSYDFDMYDVRRVDVIHGPQSTLYGRNSMMGVISVTTLSPDTYQGFNAAVEYGLYNHIKAAASLYKGKWGASVGYRHGGGHFTNSFDGRPCDRYDALNGRLRYSSRPRENLKFDNILTLSATRQGAYPYRRIVDGELQEVNYNDEGAYRRIDISEAVVLKRTGGALHFNSVSGIQVLFDRMDMDQDYTPKDVFTLRQSQREYALTQDISFRPASHPTWWNSQTGANLTGRYDRMSAPVTFKSDGINGLILDNANAGIPDNIGSLGFDESSFPITSEFGILNLNAALYHESYWNVGNWNFVTGIRLDYEFDLMDYDSESTVHYRFAPIMTASKAFSTIYKGRETCSSFQVLPKVAVRYNIPGSGIELFAVAAQGYKAGGFNTQIFSDILQKEMMVGLMEDLGVHPEFFIADVSAAGTTYKPEYSVNCEAGFRYSHTWASGAALKASCSAFLVNCYDQQITVFPPGMNTGRMMRNAGRARSFGAEAEASAEYGWFNASASYGYANAVFLEFDDGNNDYSGKRIPYSPEHTLAVQAGAVFHPKGGKLQTVRLSADCKAAGRIWWNEGNTLSQPFYACLGAYASFEFDKLSVYLRGDNLTGTEYNVFYFKSMGNEFLQNSPPMELRLGLSINL